jgi:hypothetical protein
MERNFNMRLVSGLAFLAVALFAASPASADVWGKVAPGASAKVLTSKQNADTSGKGAQAQLGGLGALMSAGVPVRPGPISAFPQGALQPLLSGPAQPAISAPNFPMISGGLAPRL